ncbi:GPW/gp25 family protein [Candidatus Amarolinea aalborgensis]|uniref:GPW/gp25 family protein n=1 Tax=Candidatus Amarolinea aalborgensis TaxID=2249329 RepID=UPI003BFA3417
MADFLGSGWSFPIRIDKQGEIALVSREEDIRQAILVILGTSPGERVMRPDFGAGLKALVFEPINTATKALVKHRVEEALLLWEPRIDSVEITMADERSLGRLLLDIHYRVRATNTFFNLVYPFYLLEGKQS